MMEAILLSRTLYSRYENRKTLECITCSSTLELFDVIVPTTKSSTNKKNVRCIDCAINSNVLEHRRKMIRVSPNIRRIVFMLSKKLGMREVGRLIGRRNSEFNRPHNPRSAKSIIEGKTEWIRPNKLQLISRLAKEHL